MSTNIDNSLHKSNDTSTGISLKSALGLGSDKASTSSASINKAATTSYLNSLSYEQDNVGESLSRSMNKLNHSLSQAASSLSEGSVDEQAEKMAVYSKLASKIIERDSSLQEKVAQDLSKNSSIVRNKDASESLQKAMDNLPSKLKEGTQAGKDLAKFMVENLVTLSNRRQMGAGLERDLAVRQINIPKKDPTSRQQNASAKVLSASIEYVKNNQPEVLAKITTQEAKSPTPRSTLETKESLSSSKALEQDSTYLSALKAQRNHHHNTESAPAPQDKISAEISKRIHNLIAQAANNAKSGNLINLSPEEAERFDRSITTQNQNSGDVLERIFSKNSSTNAADGELPPPSSQENEAKVRQLSLSELSARASKLQSQFRQERQRIVQEGKLPDPAQMPEMNFDKAAIKARLESTTTSQAQRAAQTLSLQESLARARSAFIAHNITPEQANMDDQAPAPQPATTESKPTQQPIEQKPVAQNEAKIATTESKPAQQPIEQKPVAQTEAKTATTESKPTQQPIEQKPVAQNEAKIATTESKPAQQPIEQKPVAQTETKIATTESKPAQQPIEQKPVAQTEAKIATTESKPTQQPIEQKPVAQNEAKIATTESKPTQQPIEQKPIAQAETKIATTESKPATNFSNTVVNLSFNAIQSSSYGGMDIMPGMTIPVSHFGNLDNDTIQPNQKALEALKLQARLLAAQISSAEQELLKSQQAENSAKAPIADGDESAIQQQAKPTIVPQGDGSKAPIADGDEAAIQQQQVKPSVVPQGDGSKAPIADGDEAAIQQQAKPTIVPQGDGSKAPIADGDEAAIQQQQAKPSIVPQGDGSKAPIADGDESAIQQQAKPSVVPQGEGTKTPVTDGDEAAIQQQQVKPSVVPQGDGSKAPIADGDESAIQQQAKPSVVPQGDGSKAPIADGEESAIQQQAKPSVVPQGDGSKAPIADGDEASIQQQQQAKPSVVPQGDGSKAPVADGDESVIQQQVKPSVVPQGDGSKAPIADGDEAAIQQQQAKPSVVPQGDGSKAPIADGDESAIQQQAKPSVVPQGDGSKTPVADGDESAIQQQVKPTIVPQGDGSKAPIADGDEAAIQQQQVKPTIVPQGDGSKAPVADGDDYAIQQQQVKPSVVPNEEVIVESEETAGAIKPVVGAGASSSITTSTPSVETNHAQGSKGNLYAKLYGAMQQGHYDEANIQQPTVADKSANNTLGFNMELAKPVTPGAAALPETTVSEIALDDGDMSELSANTNNSKEAVKSNPAQADIPVVNKDEAQGKSATHTSASDVAKTKEFLEQRSQEAQKQQEVLKDKQVTKEAQAQEHQELEQEKKVQAEQVVQEEFVATMQARAQKADIALEQAQLRNIQAQNSALGQGQFDEDGAPINQFSRLYQSSLSEQKAEQARVLGSSQINTVGDTNIKATGTTIASNTTHNTEEATQNALQNQAPLKNQTVGTTNVEQVNRLFGAGDSAIAQGNTTGATLGQGTTTSGQAQVASQATTSAQGQGTTTSGQAQAASQATSAQGQTTASPGQAQLASQTTAAPIQGAISQAPMPSPQAQSNLPPNVAHNASAVVPEAQALAGVSSTSNVASAEANKGMMSMPNNMSSPVINLDEESLQDEIIKNVMQTVPSDDLDEFNLKNNTLGNQALSGVVADTDLTEDNNSFNQILTKSQGMPNLSDSAAIVPTTSAVGASQITSGQNAPIPEESVVNNVNTPKEGGFFRRLASLFGRKEVETEAVVSDKSVDPSKAALEQALNSSDSLAKAQESATALANMRSNSLDALVNRLQSAANDQTLPPKMQEQAQNLIKALQNPVHDLKTVSSWLNFVTGPMSPSSSQAMALHQWAFMLLCIRFEQIGKNVDKFLKKTANGNQKLASLETTIKDHAKLNKELDEVSVSKSHELLKETLGQVERMQQQIQSIPQDQSLLRYIPLPPNYQGGKEGSFSAQKRKDEDGGTSWHLNFNLDLEDLGGLQVKVKLRFPEVQMSFVAEKFETLQKVQAHMPELNARLKEIGLTSKGSNARLGPVHFNHLSKSENKSQFKFEGNAFNVDA